MSNDNFEVQLFEDLISESEPKAEPKKRTTNKKSARPIVEELLAEEPVADKASKDTPDQKKTQKKPPSKAVSEDKTPKKQNFIMKYSSVGLSRMDKVIKAIAFLLSAIIFLAFALAAVVIVLLDDIFMVVAAAVLLLGVAISIITLLLLFGFGQIITQNNQILRRFNEMSNSD